MERLSELMDGELNDSSIDGELDRIEGDPQNEAIWASYHLIGDVLRGEVVTVGGIGQRVHVVLANEPTILAPRPRKRHRFTQRLVLPLAASVCGVAVVAWLALSNNSAISPVNNAGTPEMLAASPEIVQRAEATEADSISEYLMAHQQFSPSTAMQGVVPYVRTVSSGDGAR